MPRLGPRKRRRLALRFGSKRAPLGAGRILALGILGFRSKARLYYGGAQNLRASRRLNRLEVKTHFFSSALGPRFRLPLIFWRFGAGALPPSFSASARKPNFGWGSSRPNLHFRVRSFGAFCGEVPYFCTQGESGKETEISLRPRLRGPWGAVLAHSHWAEGVGRGLRYGQVTHEFLADAIWRWFENECVLGPCRPCLGVL